MNSRIELVSDTEVRIERWPLFFVTLSRSVCCDHGYRLDGNSDGDLWDAEGRAALMDCLACLRDTGSFAALADTSAVPYQNKRMRVKANEFLGMPEKEIVIAAVFENGVSAHTDTVICNCGMNNLLPLTAPEPPAPKVRPWTKEEAAPFIGRWILNPERTSAPKISGVFEWHVQLSNGTDVTFEELVKWRFDGTKTFCGVELAN